MSFAQDIISSVTRGRLKTPKHVALAVLVQSLTGSAELVKVLNRFGHTISYDLLEEAETAIATSIANDSAENNICVPSNIKPGIFSTFCLDNNDLNEETLQGTGTNHCTNGIIIQKESDWCENVARSSATPTVDQKRRSLNVDVLQELEQYTSGNRKGPPTLFEETKKVSDCQSDFMIDHFKTFKKDFCYLLSRMSFDKSILSVVEQEQSIPAWTGYNMITSSVDVPRKDVIGYLQVIDSSPTDLSTVYTILKRSLSIADKIGLNDVVVVFDQAIYAKALEIIWAKPNEFKRIVLRMGSFHTACAFMAVIGKRVADAGLSDLLVELGVLGSGSVNGVVECRQYNRAIRLHKLVLEALERIRWQSFGTWLESNFLEDFSDENVLHNFLSLIDLLRNFPSKDRFDDLLNSVATEKLLKAYSRFCNTYQGPMKSFWNSYIEMIKLLLNFIRATREGNWELHLDCLREFLPWIFAYDRQNYSRYLTVYLANMCSLPKTHPEAHAHLSSWGFGVQRTLQPFSLTPVDQTIEQTLNRDTKTKGGIVGFSINKNAVQRWILIAHERASISNKCRELAGLQFENSFQSKDLGNTRRKRDEIDVLKIKNTVIGWSNPFESSDKLTNISSGVVADTTSTDDLLSAKSIGMKAVDEFIGERLNSNNKAFHDPISKFALKTFSVKTKVSRIDKNTMIKADRNLFARLLVIAQTRELNMREVLKYELGPIPWSMATTDGSLVKTHKSALCSVLEKSVEQVNDVPADAVWIFDAMAVIQSLKKIPATFEDVAFSVLLTILKIAPNNCRRMEIVADQYFTYSIKDLERQKRSCSGLVITKITRPSQPCPRQWKKFLSSGENKTQLINFFVDEWCTQKYKSKLDGKKIFVAHDNLCHLIWVEDDIVLKQDCTELYSNQEEADTRMFLHVSHAVEAGYHSIVIRSSDTDVEVLAIYFQTILDANFFLVSATLAKTRIIDITSVSRNLGEGISRALPGLHAFSGCDSTSAFSGKGKSKFLDVLSKHQSFVETMSSFGEGADISNEFQVEVEQFLCLIYGHSVVGFTLFCKSKSIQCHHLPPTKDTLHKHVLRANYQTFVWKSSLQSKVSFPSLYQNGWVLENNAISVNWMDNKPASDALLLLISCGCKTYCTTRRYSCVSQHLTCTDSCRCSDICQNKRVNELIEESDEDSDSDKLI